MAISSPAWLSIINSKPCHNIICTLLGACFVLLFLLLLRSVAVQRTAHAVSQTEQTVCVCASHTAAKINLKHQQAIRVPRCGVKCSSVGWLFGKLHWPKNHCRHLCISLELDQPFSRGYLIPAPADMRTRPPYTPTTVVSPPYRHRFVCVRALCSASARTHTCSGPKLRMYVCAREQRCMHVCVFSSFSLYSRLRTNTLERCRLRLCQPQRIQSSVDSAKERATYGTVSTTYENVQCSCTIYTYFLEIFRLSHHALHMALYGMLCHNWRAIDRC